MILGREGVGIRGEVLRVQPQPEKHFGQKVENFSQTCYFLRNFGQLLRFSQI